MMNKVRKFSRYHRKCSRCRLWFYTTHKRGEICERCKIPKGYSKEMWFAKLRSQQIMVK